MKVGVVSLKIIRHEHEMSICLKDKRTVRTEVSESSGTERGRGLRGLTYAHIFIVQFGRGIAVVAQLA